MSIAPEVASVPPPLQRRSVVRSRARRPCAPFLAAAMLLAPGTSAQQEPVPVPPEPKSEPEKQETSYPNLGEIVVSAERGVPLTYPGGRDVIEPETLAKYPDATTATILRRVPGVYVLPENGNDARIHVGLRGNDPRRSGLTAVLVDGIPVAEAPYGNTDIDALPLAFERIWRADVIRGGASIRYGPNSAGGIVNFLTEPIPESTMLRFGGRYGSYGDHALWTTAGGTWDRLGVLVSGVHKAGDGFRDHGDYVDRDGSVKLRYAVSETETLSGSVSRFFEPHSNQSGGLTQADYDQDPTQSTRDSYFQFDANRYVAQYENRIDADTNVQILAWWQDGTRILGDVRPILPPFTQRRVQQSRFYSGALEGRYAWTGDFLGFENSFYHSARYLVEKNDELYYRTPLPSGPVEQYDLNALFKGHAFAVFSEDRIALTDELEWALGFRIESIVMTGLSREDGNQVFKNYNELLPETNFAWTFAPDVALYGSYQQTFYPPQYETGFDPASVLYAPTKPESADAYELGVRSRNAPGLEASLALFESRFSDKIDFVNTPDGKVPVNSGTAVSKGAELELSYELGAAFRSLDGLLVYGSYTEQRSEITSGPNDGNDTPGAPHHLASWGAEYDHRPSGLWARIGGSYSAESFRDPANTPVGTVDGLNGPVPGYTLWDAAVGWHQRPDGTGLGLSVGVTNLFEEDYFRRFATGIYPGEPRQLSAAVSYTISL